jgi:hypothetical protein
MRLKALFTGLACALLTSCVPLGRGTLLIVGVGVVRVERTNQVQVVRSSALGLNAGPGNFQLGISSTLTARVPTNSQTVLELNGHSGHLIPGPRKQ